MRHNSRVVVIIAVLMVFICTPSVQSQATEKFEVGGQFSLLRLSHPATVPTGVTCAQPPCLTVPGERRETQAGFGGRFGYNITPNVALEAELNFFPSVDSFGTDQLFGDGHQLQGLFGLKIGKRFEKVGIFAKARPGFLRVSKGDLQQRPDTGCIAVFPPPLGCFVPDSKTHFTIDVGGVFEIYPSKRTVIRFDVGDTIVRFEERRVPLIFSPLGLVALPVAAETKHNLQATIGVGFRF